MASSTDPVGPHQLGAAALHHIEVPYVYLLECADGTYYVGSAKDLDLRLQQHAAGSADAFTAARHRQPIKLVWAHECERIDEAYVLERKIKGWRREKKLALIEGRFGDLPALSRNRTSKGQPFTS